MLLFTNGLLLGLLSCCVLIIYANARKPRRCKLPHDRHWKEEHNGTVSFQDMPGFQNIPCLIEIYHTSRWEYDERTRPVEHHTEIRRYRLGLVLPAALITLDKKLYYRVVDSDGVALAAYIGASDTLIQA